MQTLTESLLNRWNRLDESWRFGITVFVIARLFYSIWAWGFLTLQPLAVQNFTWSHEPILTLFNLQDSRIDIYLRTVNQQILTFRPTDKTVITDLQSGSQWDVSTGLAISGPYKGSTLTRAGIAPSVFFPYHGVEPHPIRWLAIWQRFDVNWYISIAENDYGSINGDLHFPPLYPLLIRLLRPLFGDAFLAGLVISHIATLFMIRNIYCYFFEAAGRSPARHATAFMLLYPASFFLFTAYTESLFLLFALLSLRQMKRRAWHWSGFWIFCAILTRLQGIALILPLAYIIWKDDRFAHKFSSGFGLALAGFGGLFYVILRSRFAESNVLPLAEPDLHARLGLPWESYWYAIQTLLTGRFSFVDLLNFVVTTLFLLLVIAIWRTTPPEDSLYTTISFLIMIIRIVDTQPLNSMLRYSLTLFPVFLVFGLAGNRPWIRRLIVYTFIPLNMYLSAQFLLWGWVA